MRLENYAVIDNLVVEFGPGLNLLTGETGAGKSILVDALALLLGDKASTAVIRAGPERAAVSAWFEAEGVQTADGGWKGIRTRIEELEQREQDRLRLVDLWIFQKREIEEGRLQSGEDEQLETEKRVLANAEKIYNAAMNAFDLLYEGNGSTASSAPPCAI